MSFILFQNSLFGEGTYLSNEYAMALQYSPQGASQWEYSLHGTKISVLAVCEVVDRPADVITSRAAAPAAYIRGSMGGSVPEKYVVVRNDDLIRVRYLFVYAPSSYKLFVRDYLMGKDMTSRVMRPQSATAGALVRSCLAALYRRYTLFWYLIGYLLLWLVFAFWFKLN